MNNSSAKVVLDSIAPNGRRLISIECRYWRAIHSELMTHRAFARNAASSRAIPFIRSTKCDQCNGGGSAQHCDQCDDYPCPKCNGEQQIIVPNCTYSRILDDPFMPEFIGSEQKGMQSGDEFQEPGRSAALGLIDEMRLFCLEKCKHLYHLGVHKSIINRYLEPWSYITTLITATEWANFLRLRVHPAAEKHFNKVAGQIKEAILGSVPKKLAAGDWHLPYIDSVDHNADTHQFGIDLRKREDVPKWIEHMKRVSAARCARLSYLTHDGVRDTVADLRIFDTLINRNDDVIHCSPLEHVAQASVGLERSGPFIGWKQFRKEFVNENVEG